MSLRVLSKILKCRRMLYTSDLWDTVPTELSHRHILSISEEFKLDQQNIHIKSVCTVPHSLVVKVCTTYMPGSTDTNRLTDCHALPCPSLPPCLPSSLHIRATFYIQLTALLLLRILQYMLSSF